MKYTADLVIFGISTKESDNCRGLAKKSLSVLLVNREKEPYKGKWCLPGGYIFEDETSLNAAKRILKKETNLSDFYLEQLKVFDDINRDPRGRTITISYMALIDREKIKQELLESAKWFEIDTNSSNSNIDIILSNDKNQMKIKIKKNMVNDEAEQVDYSIIANELGFDHGLILNEGIQVLRNKAMHTDIIFNIMPEKFTIGELRQVYEIILNKKLVNSAFRRIINPKLEATNEIIKNGGHRPSQYFKYKKETQTKD